MRAMIPYYVYSRLVAMTILIQASPNFSEEVVGWNPSNVQGRYPTFPVEHVVQP